MITFLLLQTISNYQYIKDIARCEMFILNDVQILAVFIERNFLVQIFCIYILYFLRNITLRN